MDQNTAPGRGRRRLSAAVVGGVVLTSVAAVGSLATAGIVEGRITGALGCALPEGASVVDVTTTGNAVASLATRHVDQATVELRAVPVGETSLDVVASTTDLTLDDALPLADRLGPVQLVVSADAAHLDALLRDGDVVVAPPLPASSRLVVADGALGLTTTARGVPVTVVLAPAVDDGVLTLTPREGRLGARAVDVSVLRGVLDENPHRTADLVADRTVRLPSLPDGLGLISVDVVDDEVRLGLQAGPDLVADHARATHGSCS